MADVDFWEGLWSRDGGLRPGELFDKLTPAPALVQLVCSGDLSTGKSALVPGCGRGYDVTLLAASGQYKHVVGLELSPTAVQEAIKRLRGLHGKDRPLEGSVEFLSGDFFQHSFGDETFDLIYDYTFLCALPPHTRSAWAARMHNLLADDGELVTLIYPIPLKEVDVNSGPPYPVSLDLVRNLLEPAGFRLYKFEALPPELCHPGRDGSKGMVSALARWRKTQ